MRTMWLLGVGLVLSFALPVEQVRGAFDHSHWIIIQAPPPTEFTKAPVSEFESLFYVVGRDVELHEESRWQGISASSGRLLQSKRASAQYVGAVMAMLATFHEAGVLPPEADPRANQLIRSLIQFQSMFLKSEEPAVHEYFSTALSRQWGARTEEIRAAFYEQGWSSESLEALVEYSRQHGMWEQPGMEVVFQSYYLSQADWALVEEIFLKARERLVSQHQNIHKVFSRKRQGMPGGNLPQN
ncbi:hypothetical protein [Candidatus Nitronereus thalassa]|uniref:Uncharacterized protein n=1 Tax=Candidatus Nitronereus thalassa TaxID=3020898 RepID=A0ABU3K5J3_9BACT|nr:hypothetical protein [Candidatus Nitronereus thalassa]MDT7041687.1 hypothetical protein [Candidatus Nitronereus thalassa]